MEIGTIKKTTIVTPLENPVPQPVKIPDTLPIEVTQPEREKVPA